VGVGHHSGHFWILAARRVNAPDTQSCTGARAGGTVQVRGHRGQWITCPQGSELNSGHVILVWMQKGVRYGVSLHGDTELNRRLALAIAEHLALDRGG